MGLDITHYKAILELPKNSELISIGGQIRGKTGAETRESFCDFNVPFEHFENYIQIIDYPNIKETAIVVKHKEKNTDINKQFANSGYKILLDNEDLDKNLAEYENEKNLKNLNKHINDNPFTEWKVISYYEYEKREGFYFQELGYQRKGMNNKFWKRFCSSDIYEYGLLEDFEFAYSCLHKLQQVESNADFELRKKEFKKHFIDNFELGTSFMSVSY